MSIEKHEEKYFHTPKKPIGVILYLLISLGAWGYLIHRLGVYPELANFSIAFPFIILFIVIITLPISHWIRDWTPNLKTKPSKKEGSLIAVLFNGSIKIKNTFAV